jgi:hypothetical protein
VKLERPRMQRMPGTIPSVISTIGIERTPTPSCVLIMRTAVPSQPSWSDVRRQTQRQRLLCQAGAKPGETSHVDTHGTVVGTTLLGRSPDFVDLDDTEAGVDHALARLERAAAAGLVGPVRLVDLHGVAGSGCKERAVGQGARCACWG